VPVDDDDVEALLSDAGVPPAYPTQTPFDMKKRKYVTTSVEAFNIT
jgi:hypothetical protein